MEGRAVGSSLVSIKPRKRMSVWYPLQRSTMLLWPKKAQTRSQSLWHVTRSSVFAAATCRESQVPNGKALFFFFGNDMLGLQSSGLEVRQQPRQWTGRGGCSRGAETVSNSQDRGRNEGRSENLRRSPSAQLTATGQVNSRRRIGADGKLADQSTGRKWRKPLTQFGENVLFQRVGQE